MAKSEPNPRRKVVKPRRSKTADGADAVAIDKPSGHARTQRIPPHVLESTAQLPRAKDGPCYLQTRDGRRMTFSSQEELLRWCRRTPDVVAICLDGCAWRTWETVLYLLQRGLELRDAFEQADLAGWQTSPALIAELRRSQ